MTTLSALIKRNTKLFFKDKGMFFTSLITPLILLVLYATFLADVYRDSFAQGLPAGIIDSSLIDAVVGGQLLSSLLAVSCVTVSFCANMLMVTDKVTGARRDLTMTPVRPSVLALGYYISSLLVTLIICLITTVAGLAYVATIEWYFSVSDILLLLLDVILLVMFGTALSSVINFFLSSQGQISAVGTIVSSGYGFICGAYMPISQFAEGLQVVISCLPGTYGTALLRNHSMRGAFDAMTDAGLPAEALNELRAVVDCNVEFFGHTVTQPAMYAILGGSVALLLGAYVLIHAVRQRTNK